MIRKRERKKERRREGGNHDLKMAGLFAAILLIAGISSTSGGAVSIYGIQLPPLCTLKLVSGFDCPGCGITRAIILAVHGEFTQSYLTHLWGIPTVALLLLQIPYRLFLACTGQKSLPLLPVCVRKWTTHFVFLSLLFPWVIKTVSMSLILYVR